MLRTVKPTKTILDAAAADGAGTSVDTAEYKSLTISVDSDGVLANLTIKIQGSILDQEPDFDAAQTATNQWDYINISDLEDKTAFSGDTGLSFNGSDFSADHRQYNVDANIIKWVNVIVSSYSAGEITVRLAGANT